MAQLLKVYQVFYEQNQREKLIYEPYYNPNCTVYFENEVIKTLILEGKHLDAECFGIVSHNLVEKMGGVVFKNESKRKFFNSTFANFADDNNLEHVITFQTLKPHDPITEADKFHPNFSGLFKKVVNKIGYDWKPEVFNTVIYSNAFVAYPEIYEDYVKKMLIPAMEVMRNMPEAWEDSGYYKKLPEHLARKFGRPYYTYHTFICERLFSFYAHINKLNCIQF